MKHLFSWQQRDVLYVVHVDFLQFRKKNVLFSLYCDDGASFIMGTLILLFDSILLFFSGQVLNSSLLLFEAFA